MSTKELQREAMALPLVERVALAQVLWKSIEDEKPRSLAEEVNWTLEEASRRDAELAAGTVEVRTHEQVMRAARKAIE